MKKYFLLFLIVTISFQVNVFAQESEEKKSMLPEGISLSNQMKYSYDITLKQEIMENWLNLDYRHEIFSAGIRFDIFQPNDPNPAVNRNKNRYSEIDYKYIKAEIGESEIGMDITAGNYYALFGRGMVLKIYEDRNVRIDNNLLGVKIDARYNNLRLKALSGMAENTSKERNNILHAVDLEYSFDFPLKAGASFAINIPNYDNVAKTSLTSIRLQPSIWNFDFYSEFGIKQNADIKKSAFNNNESIVGKAFYTGGNFYLGNFAIMGEYKLYDNFLFQSDDGTIIYNTPPAVRKDYTYILLNRHPSALNQSNEQGFQFEGMYNFEDESAITLSYGITKSLNSNSYYQRIAGTNLPVQTQLKEVFAHMLKHLDNGFTVAGGFQYNEELTSNTKNITPVAEIKYNFFEINTIRLAYEHQQTKNRTTFEKYFDDVVTVEYLRSPKFNAAVVAEMQTKEPESGRKVRRVWTLVQFGYKFGDHTDISLLLGSRQAGNICIGGVCRYEPEFRGIEIKMLTRL